MTGDRRGLVRRADGALIDQVDGVEVPVADLASRLGLGERFKVIDEGTGRRCTFEVLAAALRVRVGDQPDVLAAVLTCAVPPEVRRA